MKYRIFCLIAFVLAITCLTAPSVLAAELVRSVEGDETCNPRVSIVVTPDLTQSYAVEERLPTGLTPTNISGNGIWDEQNRTIRWGLYVDNGQTLSYDITGADLSYEFANHSSVNGREQTISGVMQVSVVCTEVISRVDKPLFDPPSGTMNAATVTISTSTLDAIIHYTIDGSAPDADSPIYNGTPIVLSGQTTIRALAIKEDMQDSEIANALYPIAAYAELSTTIDNQTCPPVVTTTIQPNPSVSSYGVEEQLSGDAVPATINEGGVWDAVNRKVKWGPFADNTARVLSFELLGDTGGYTISGTASFNGMSTDVSGEVNATVSCALPRVVTPEFSVERGTPVPIIGLAISTTTEGAEIHYTVDGSKPDRLSPLYTTPFDVTNETTVRARAFKDGLLDSYTGGAFYPYIYIRATSERVITAGNECSAEVSITITPVEGYSAYALEENIPDTAFVSEISDGGVWNSTNHTIHWGVFLEPTGRTVSYKLTGTIGAQNVKGRASFDGVTATTEGDRQAVIACELPDTVATPTFAPGNGTLVPVDVSISTTTAGAAIYYTTDGSLPDTGSALYTAPLHLDATTVLRVRAFLEGMFDSAPITAVYYEEPAEDQSSAVRSIPVDQSCRNTVSIIVTPDTSVSSYAVEEVLPFGLEPASINNNGWWDAASRTLHWGPFQDNTERTFSYEVSGANSSYPVSGQVSFDGQSRPITGAENLAIVCVTEIEQTQAPVFDPTGGEVPLDVTISSPTSGAEIYYTVDGSMPTPASLLYSAPLHLESQTTLRAMAVADGMDPSPVVSTGYAEPEESKYTELTREIVNTDVCVTQVDITIEPTANVHSYALEEYLPSGLLPVSINNAGTWNEASRKIKWGPFTDNIARTFSYDLIGIPGSYALSGWASFDGSHEKLPGQEVVTITCLDDRVSGVLARYPFDGDGADHSGYGNNGEPYNVTYTADRFDNSLSAAEFNGTDSYIQVLDSPSLQVTDTLSVSFWARRPQYTGREMVLEKGNSQSVDFGIALDGADSSESMFLFYFGESTRGVVGVLDNEWHHYAVVASDGAADPLFYIDGYPATITYTDGAGSVSLNASVSDLYIGGNPLTEAFSSLILDELVVYDRFLTGDEIAGLASETPNPVALPDLVVNSVQWLPETDLAGGEQVTFTATIANIGEGTSIYPFRVNFQINGVSIGAELLARTIPIGEAAQISKSWTAEVGMHNLQVIADSSASIAETDEENNALTVELPQVFDKTPPEEVTGLGVVAELNSLLLNWTPSTNTENDLAGYRVYLDGVEVSGDLAASENSFELQNLATASAYQIKVTVFDDQNNESSGVSITGYTKLPNPSGLAVQSFNSYAQLQWNGVEPIEFLQYYRIYQSTSDFSSVAEMEPVLTTGDTAITVAGLTNNTTYFFAVTSVNLSDGEVDDVVTISATPIPDTVGPLAVNLQAGDVGLIDNLTLSAASSISLDGSDPSGVSRVEFSVDGVLQHTDSSAADGYSWWWEIEKFSDGAHSLTITLFDTLGNITTLSYNVTIDLAAPSTAPVIDQPTGDIQVNSPAMTVTGQAGKNNEVILYRNGSAIGSWRAVAADGSFSLVMTLIEGDNSIQVRNRNRGGEGPLSESRLVTLDTSIPDSPNHLEAEAAANGVIRLSWSKTSATTVRGYKLFRSSSAFTTAAEAVQINSSLITSTSFTDLPTTDGTYYYRVSVVALAGNESALSNSASTYSDRVAPYISTITYSPEGNFDPVSGRMAPGVVNLELELSEALQTAPFLSINSSGASPLTVELQKTSATTYSGFFVIPETAPTGEAFAVFSGRDMAGNRGTEINSGRSVIFDTTGPSVVRLASNPATPVRNDSTNPVTIQVNIGLNERMGGVESPYLYYLLSGTGRQEIEITPLVEAAPETGEAQAFTASFTLPADAGLNETEYLEFRFAAVDDLGNPGSAIKAVNRIEVFQGDLPPLATPMGFTGEAWPGGRLKLNWYAVDDAAGYQIFRQAPGESDLTPYQRTTELEFIDNTAVDGSYTYTVASIRQEIGLEALSAPTNPLILVADSVAPDRPENLKLSLTGRGILAHWEEPNLTETVTYSLYRSAANEIDSVAGLTPLATGIGQIEVIDPTPSTTDHCYVVTAVDGAGNESEPSISDYLNFDLLPVATLTVVQRDNNLPLVSWTVSGTPAGYDIYLGAGDEQLKLNQNLLTQTSFVDNGFGGEERLYSIIVQDNFGAESPPRSILLPELEMTLLNGADPDEFTEQLDAIDNYVNDLTSRISSLSRPRRGLMNRLEYLLANHSNRDLEHLQLKVDIGGRSHLSDTFSLLAGEYRIVPVIVGGYSNLLDIAPLELTAIHTPNSGERMEIIRNGDVTVGDGMLVAGILNEEFTRGVSGEVRFTLENTSSEEIEIVTATASGQTASDEIIFRLRDSDDNIISAVNFKQTVGSNVVALANGRTVARIAPGAIFVSEPVELQVPLTAPREAAIELDISAIHYHLGQEDQVEMRGLASSKSISMVDTSYYGEILAVTPEQSFGDDHIITGRAVERSSGTAMAYAALDLVISVKGFERSYEVHTNADGNFSFTFTPLAEESGIYTVYAVHPDLKDRQPQATFVINRVVVSPTTVNANIPTNYEQQLQFTIRTDEGTSLHNVRLTYAAEDQAGGTFAQGVSVTPQAPINTISSGDSATLSAAIMADNSAATDNQLILRVISDESPAGGWAVITVNTHFSEALPVLNFNPTHVETGLARDEMVSESVTLSNNGLADLEDISLELISENGSPAPTWVQLSSSSSIGDLSVGQSYQVDLTFSPTSTVTEGYHTFFLRVRSANYAQTDIGLYVAITQAGIGNIQFKISDIYTGTFDENNILKEGLSGARIRVQNDMVTSIEQVLVTDSYGEVLFENLPSGSYKCRITAPDHQEYIGRFWIRAGITTNEEVFLKYNLVTVEWEVVPITIEDKYEIILNTTFKTSVPAAVVIAEPASVYLPRMQSGDIYNGEFTLTNFGLIQAEAIEITLPIDDSFFHYESLGGIPDIILPGERIVIPYRITCLLSPGLEDAENGSGGGCTRYTKKTTISYGFKCSNNHWEHSSTPYMVIYDNNECTGDGEAYAAITSGGGSSSIQVSSSSGGTGTKPSFGANAIVGAIDNCEPIPELKEDDIKPEAQTCNVNYASEKKDSQQSQMSESSINLRTGQYMDSLVDIAVKVPGGMITATRQYFNHNWNWFHLRKPLKIFQIMLVSGFSGDSSGSAYVTSGNTADNLNNCKTLPPQNTGFYVEHRGVKYWALPDVELEKDLNTGQIVGNGVFIHDTYKIIKQGDTLRWEDGQGNWELYGIDGEMTSYGNRTGVIGQLLYETFTSDIVGQTAYNGKRVIGVLDRNGRQVLWYDYAVDALSNESPLRVSSIHDNTGRQVNYGYFGEDTALAAFVRSSASDSSSGTALEIVTDPYTRLRPIKTFTNVLGAETAYEYNDKNQLSKKIKPDGPTVFIIYNDSGVISSVLDENGQGHYFTNNYDRTTEQVTASVRYTSGRNKSIWYDKCGDTVRYDLNGRNIFKIFKEDNRNLLEIDGNGLITHKEYDEWGNVTKIIRPDGATVTIEYEHTFNKPIKITNVLGVVTAMSYDGQSNMVRLAEAAGTAVERVTVRTFNDMGQVLTSTVQASGNAAAATTTYTYDVNGNLTSIRDPEGNTTSYSNFDNSGNAAEVKDARQKTWAMEYDNRGQLISHVDPLSNSTGFTYNKAGDLVDVVDPDNKHYLMGYDIHHNRLKITDPLGGEVKTTYDLNSMPITVTDQDGHLRSLTFDNDQRLTSQIDGAGNQISMYYNSSLDNPASLNDPTQIDFPTSRRKLYYDTSGRVIRQVDVLNDTTSYETVYTRDAIGNILTLTDPEGRTTFYTYDALNRLIRIEKPGNTVTTMKYDVRNNLVELTDANGGTTLFQYDRANRLIKQQRPMGQSTDYTYDANGNLSTMTDALGRRVSYQYNDVNSPLTVSYYSGDDHTTPVKETIFTYNSLGLLTSYNDGQTSAVYEWDELKRKLQETIDYGSFSLSYHYDYYANGLKKSYTAPNGEVYHYSYDTNNRLTGIDLPGLGRISYNSFTWNAPNQLTLPGGSQLSTSYDAIMRIKNMRYTDPGGNELQRRDYNYSSVNLLAKETEHGNYSYQYDELSRLVSAINPQVDDEAYTYDKVGNRLSVDAGALWAYNLNNELQGFDQTAYTYDAAGNMTSKSVNGVLRNFIYDTENRLSKVTQADNSAIADYYYDPFGRRLWKDVGGNRTYYLYNEEGLAGEYDQNGTELKRYGFTPGGLWSTKPLYQKIGGQYYFYLNDHLGTPQQMMDSTGRIVWKALYNSFGKCTVQIAEIENNLRFPGQYYDAETGLSYNWNRYYDSEIGRYVAADPIGLKGGVNLYRYASNNPQYFIDFDAKKVSKEKIYTWLRDEGINKARDLDPFKRIDNFIRKNSCPGAEGHAGDLLDHVFDKIRTDEKFNEFLQWKLGWAVDFSKDVADTAETVKDVAQDHKIITGCAIAGALAVYYENNKESIDKSINEKIKDFDFDIPLDKLLCGSEVVKKFNLSLGISRNGDNKTGMLKGNCQW